MVLRVVKKFVRSELVAEMAEFSVVFPEPLLIRENVLLPPSKQEYLVWNPPYIDENDLKQGRISTIQETSRIFRFLMQRGIRVIVFCRVSRSCPPPTPS